ncbi:MAG: 16S rRNA (uracil(1498)-N(3))-methyltransferase [Deltaproteobacteria bacterium]|nr:16S rRNA (uracil(1498)-N(3))-methyltransferase [Deltaproteobacteria bacterium]
MSLRRFLVEPRALAVGEVALPPEEAAHARKVLRLTPGAEVELIDGQGRRARGLLTRLDKSGAVVQVEGVEQAASPKPRLVLCPGLLKAPAMDLLAVKLTELAVDQVRPVLTQRAVPKTGAAKAKLERWQRLAGQALKQCGASRAPEFLAPTSLEEALAVAPAQAAKLLLYEDEERTNLSQVLPSLTGAGEVWALIGPEGGFTPEEAAQAVTAGFTSCRLPHTILRAETASLALAGVIRFAL